MPRKLSITALRERINDVCELVRKKKIPPADAIKEVFGRKKIRRTALAAFKSEVIKLVSTKPEDISKKVETLREASLPRLVVPFLLSNIREAHKRNETLVERNSNVALKETVRTLERLDLNNHLEVIAEINRLRDVHQIVDMFNLESSLSEIRNRTDYLVEEEDTFLRAAASAMLVSINTGFLGFNIEVFNEGREDDPLSEDLESSPSMYELEALEASAEKEDALEFEAEKYLMEIFSVLSADEKILFLESIYLNTNTEPKDLRKLSRCLANMTSDNDERVNNFPLDEVTAELINPLQIVSGTLHLQLTELYSKRLEKNSFELPSLLSDTGSVLLEDDDDIEEAELDEKERAFEFEANRQEVFTVTVEEDLLQPSTGEFLELYEISACEQIRERLSFKFLSLELDSDDKEFLARAFLNDLAPETIFPIEDGIRKYNALHHATSVLGKAAKPIIMESLRSENVEVKCAAFDILLNGKLTGNWGERKLKEEIVRSCQTKTNPFLFARLLLLSREDERISSGLRESCLKILKDVLSNTNIDFAEVMENLEEEKICTYEIGNVLEMHFEDLTDTNEIKLLPYSRRLLAESLGYEMFITFAYDFKDSNPTLSDNAQIIFNAILPENETERVEALQVLLAGSKVREKLLEIEGFSRFGEKDE